MIHIHYKGHQVSSYDGKVAVTLVARALDGKCNYELYLNENVLRAISADCQTEKARASASLLAERDALNDELEKLKEETATATMKEQL
jgi:hypothetical protein